LTTPPLTNTSFSLLLHSLTNSSNLRTSFINTLVLLLTEVVALLPSPLAVASTYPVLVEERTWRVVVERWGRWGRMMMYGLIGQCEGVDGEVLTLREQQCFEAMMEVVLR